MAIPVALTAGSVLGGAFVYQRLRRYFSDTVDHLAEGSVVYHSMVSEQIEHSGIYVGGHNMVSLARSGKIVKESVPKFLEGASNRTIYVSCTGESAVGTRKVAARARKMVGKRREYNMILDNCHQFTSGCLTGDFEGAGNFLAFLKNTAADVLGADNWRIWGREEEIQRMCAKAIQEIAQNRAHLGLLLKADFDERERLLKCSFDQLKASYGIEDINGFFSGLAEMAPDLPWEDFKAFDDWMCDDETILELR